MNNYEVTVLVPDINDKNILERIEKEIEDAGGTIGKSEEWGKRELAYAIKKHGGPAGGYREGVYYYFETVLPGDKVGGINRFLETSEGVLRHLIVRANSKHEARNSKQTQSTKSKIKKPKSKKVVKRKNGNKKSK